MQLLKVSGIYSQKHHKINCFLDVKGTQKLTQFDSLSTVLQTKKQAWGEVPCPGSWSRSCGFFPLPEDTGHGLCWK